MSSKRKPNILEHTEWSNEKYFNPDMSNAVLKRCFAVFCIILFAFLVFCCRCHYVVQSVRSIHHHISLKEFNCGLFLLFKWWSDMVIHYDFNTVGWVSSSIYLTKWLQTLVDANKWSEERDF